LVLGQIFLQKSLVDRHAGFAPFCGRYDDELRLLG
jgi:hypothetical protein